MALSHDSEHNHEPERLRCTCGHVAGSHEFDRKGKGKGDIGASLFPPGRNVAQCVGFVATGSGHCTCQWFFCAACPPFPELAEGPA